VAFIFKTYIIRIAKRAGKKLSTVYDNKYYGLV